jgi:hypothetical protein
MVNDPNIIDYSGPVSSETIDTLITQLKKQRKDVGLETGTYTKIITIIIESLENIYKYTRILKELDPSKPFADPIFVIKKNGEHFVVKVGNSILNKDIPNIQGKLQKIKDCDAHELKDIYINTIKNGQFTEQGGAGLGFIKMARIADSHFDFNFEPKDETHSFFTIELQLENKKKSLVEEEEEI